MNDPQARLRPLAIAGLWVMAWLILFDLAVGLGVRRSEAMANGRPSALASYFEYGRSIEGKLDKLTAMEPDAQAQRILQAGWLNPPQGNRLPSLPREGSDLLVAVYGQSFAFHASNEAARIDGRWTLRLLGGPGAPPSHSFAALKTDAPLRKADVVVFGILASSVSKMESISGLSGSFEHPAPYTFPRYWLEDGSLREELPLISSEREFRSAFSAQSPVWLQFKNQLATNDQGFDPLIFDRSTLDGSVIARLLRRSWVAHTQDYERGVYARDKGFETRSRELQVLKAMLKQLARDTRARNERLVILLLHDRHYGDSLHAALTGTLEESGITYLSTHTLFSSDDSRNFVPDGHYSAAANRLIAQELVRLVRAPPSRKADDFLMVDSADCIPQEQSPVQALTTDDSAAPQRAQAICEMAATLAR